METVPDVMRVPVFQGEGRIGWGEKPVLAPGPGQLLLRVKANALCGSERGQFFHGSEVTPGHEAAGVVAAAGPGTRTPVGTPGVVFLMGFCGECRSCRAGATNQCADKRADMGFNRDGGYGPYEMIHESIFFPVDSDLPLDEATMLLDIMGTGGHAIGRAQRVHDDIRSLLIAGAGPIGLGVLAMARLMLGPDLPIFLTDTIPYRLNLAEQLNGIPIDVRETPVDEGIKRHGMAAVDTAIDTSGKGAARQACLNALDRRGALVCVGHGEGLSLEVSRDLIAPERAVLGSEYFRFDELPANLERLKGNREYLSRIITHRFRVQEIEEAFQTFWGGSTGKVLVVQ
jgi:threonine 3-dehydrogenase